MSCVYHIFGGTARSDVRLSLRTVEEHRGLNMDAVDADMDVMLIWMLIWMLTWSARQRLHKQTRGESVSRISPSRVWTVCLG
jgi:hypothetical protein